MSDTMGRVDFVSALSIGAFRASKHSYGFSALAMAAIKRAVT